MSVQKHEPQWWSDIFQTEMRLPQKRYRRLCILPTYCVATGSNRSRIARKFIKTFLVKVRRFFSHRPPTTSAVSCADPFEAYMYACMAAPFFCYVSPAIYGLSVSDDEADIIQSQSHTDNEV